MITSNIEINGYRRDGDKNKICQSTPTAWVFFKKGDISLKDN